ncbi:MAG TPA: 1,4-dihydroxy-2-naphthoate polyprenyltransferase [Candidatus Lumbricidophila sp.]|nr:1,4-dihydroxy-2-naphthoate polyprenyltransferase [Candidatus Lumbricidophila sp.]
MARTQRTPAAGDTHRRPQTYSKSGNPARAALARPTGQARTATLGDWVRAARIPTLAVSVAAVVLGTGASWVTVLPAQWHWIRAGLALIVAVALQIGVNFANDYSDGIRGTDVRRQGPTRLVGSGLAQPKSVLTVALVWFGIAGLAGLAITLITHHWWLLAVGAIAIAAAWFYTGGKRPYGYYALGEVAVFVFFGLVAVVGSAFIQGFGIGQQVWWVAVGAGLLAVSVLIANNLRDIDGDRIAGKRTLMTLIGRRASKVLFCICLLAPFAMIALVAVLIPGVWFVMFALLAAVPACVILTTAKHPSELVLAMKLASLTALIYGVGLGVLFAL